MAKEYDKKDHKIAMELYKKIINKMENKSIDEMNDVELRLFSISNQHVFLASKFSNSTSCDQAIKAFELYFLKYNCNIEMYEAYVLLLELTYQYEKAKEVLDQLLKADSTKPLALKFLSSYVYAAEKLQSVEECINYKKQLIKITDDPIERKRLEKELSSMEIV